MSDTPKRSRSADKQALADLHAREVAPMRPPPQLTKKPLRTLDDAPLQQRRRAARPTSAAVPPQIWREEPEDLGPVLSPLHQPTIEAHRRLSQAPLPAARSISLPDARGPLLGLPWGQPWMLALVAIISIGVILMTSSPSRTIISSYSLPGMNPPPAEIQAAPAPDTPPGEHSVLGASTITAEQIDAVLAKYGSPAAGSGQIWVEMAQKYNINAAYALAFFIHESSAGTNPGWAGLKRDGSTTHNIGNIICAGYPTCFGRFRDYPGWREGIEDWYKLIAHEYVEGRGAHTIEKIIPIYAPSVENNVPAYVNAVMSLVDSWK